MRYFTPDRAGMLNGLIRITKTFAGLWNGPQDVDVGNLLDTSITHLELARDLLAAPPATPEVIHD